MKTKTIISFLLFLISLIGHTQSDCSKYYPMDEGTSFQYTNYNTKGKVSGILDHSIINNRTINDYEVVTLTTKMSDKSGELKIESKYDITCSSEGVSIDFKSMISPQMFTQFEKFEYEITGTNLELPNELSVGIELPDANMKMVVKMGMTMNINITIKDRKVIGEETITTPSGTYNCYVLSSSLEMDMMMKIESSSKQWIAEGVGMVKEESYDAKGNLAGYSELTKFSK